jgi:hypothetical protein
MERPDTLRPGEAEQMWMTRHRPHGLDWSGPFGEGEGDEVFRTRFGIRWLRAPFSSRSTERSLKGLANTLVSVILITR